MDVQGHRVTSEFVSIDQAAGQLVVGIGRKTIVDEELGFRIQRLSVAFHQAIDLGTRGFRSRDRVGASQSRNILSKTVAGNEAMEIVSFQTESGKVVPAAHVFSRRRQAGNLSVDLEQAIIV